MKLVKPNDRQNLSTNKAARIATKVESSLKLHEFDFRSPI